MTKPVDVVVAGHICLDMIPNLGPLPAGALESPGRLFEVGGLRVTTGGLVANVGVALHRLGANVRLLATVGDDLVGMSTLEVLRRVSPSLSEHIRIRPSAESSYTVVLSRPNQDRLFLHCTGPNQHFMVSDVDFSLVEGARWFHFGYPPVLPHMFEDDGRMLVDVMQRARETGAVTSLDFTLPDPATPSGQVNWRAILERVLPHVDVFVPSLEEAVYLLHVDQYRAWEGRVTERIARPHLDAMCSDLLAMGPAIAGIKLGEHGVILQGSEASRLSQLQLMLPGIAAWSRRCVTHPAFDVTVYGTTGAGDAAYAGLIMALLEGFEPAAAARQFCAAGAASVESAEGLHGLPAAASLRSRFESGVPTTASPWLASEPE